MKMRNVLKALGFLAAVGFMAAGFFGISYGAGPEITLRYAGDLPIGNHLTRGQEFFAKRVDEITKGRVKVEVFPAGQLYSAKDYPKTIPAGAVDMAQCLLGQWTGIVPSLLVLNLPLFFDGWPHMWRTLDSEAGEILRKEMEKADVKHLFWMQDGSAGFATKFPLKKMADFKGKRVRASTQMDTFTIKDLGGSPAFMGGGEVYMALQRGTVDGGISSVTSFRDRKYYEVTKYVTEPGLTYGIYAGLMNLKKWNELPADVQKMLLAAGKDTQAWARQEVQKMDKEAMEELKNKGMEIYFLPKDEKALWRKAVRPTEDLIISKSGDLGRKLIKLAEDVR
jgi:tripartite ATP-independent transporter DctP family solute receptor